MALFIKSDGSNSCCCPSMTNLNHSCPPNPPPAPENDRKYFHEVGAEMVGNQLIIRMEKEKTKKNKKKGDWEPPCDCDVIEIKRPTATKGPRIVNGGDNNQILFRMHSKAHLTKKDDPYYRPQAIAYKINRSNVEEGDHCRKITIFPQLGGPISQEVYTDHINEGDQDIYLLRVKKKNDIAEDGNKRNLEVELHTPKPPRKPLPPCPKPPPPQRPASCEPTKNPPEKNDKTEGDKNGNGKNRKNVKNKKNGKKGK